MLPVRVTITLWVVEVHCDEGVTEVERLEIDLWADMHEADGIDTVVVGACVVAVHGVTQLGGSVGTARRHGDVNAELDEALAVMHKARTV